MHYFHYISLAKLNIPTSVLAEALTITMGDVKSVDSNSWIIRVSGGVLEDSDDFNI